MVLVRIYYIAAVRVWTGLIAQIHGIKRIAKAQGFSYDSGRNKEIGHADAFWALALACRELGFGGRRIVTARVF